MDPQQDTTLPLTWYAPNYLGKPVNVSVLGETPTGGAMTGASAAPSGGLGGGSSPTGAPSPNVKPPSSTMIRTIQDVLTGAQGIQGTTDILTKGQTPEQQPPPGSSQTPGEAIQGAGTIGAGGITGAGAAGSQMFGAGGPVMASPGLTASGEMMAEFPVVGTGGESAAFTPGAAGAGASGAEAGSAGAGAGGAAGTAAGTAGLSGYASAMLPALAAAGAESLGVSLMPQPYKGATQLAQTAFNPATALMFPDLLANVFTGKFGNLFGGKPPAISFPGSAWSSIGSQVGAATPPALPVPKNATPEQKSAIEQANAIIKSLETYQGDMPGYLGGKQSAETWTNTMNTMRSDIQNKFSQLQSLYPQAYQAFLAAQPQVPGGAPSGLAEQLSAPAAQLQAAMNQGDLATAKQVLQSYPTDAQVQALMEQYAPQLQAGQAMSQGFLRSDVMPKVTP